MKLAKPFEISKRSVWTAYKLVKANRGGAGIDNETLAKFEANLVNNLYRIWNRMSSGSYFPRTVPSMRPKIVASFARSLRTTKIPSVDT